MEDSQSELAEQEMQQAVGAFAARHPSNRFFWADFGGNIGLHFSTVTEVEARGGGTHNEIRPQSTAMMTRPTAVALTVELVSVFKDDRDFAKAVLDALENSASETAETE